MKALRPPVLMAALVTLAALPGPVPASESIAEVRAKNSMTMPEDQAAPNTLESLHQPYEQTFEKKDYALGLFKGLNKGLFNFLEGTTRGLFDILRSPVPGMRRFEHKDNQTRVL